MTSLSEQVAKLDEKLAALKKQLVKEQKPDLMAENGNMKMLLLKILPDIESRVDGLRELFPGQAVLTALHRNEMHVRKIKEFTAGFNMSSVGLGEKL